MWSLIIAMILLLVLVGGASLYIPKSSIYYTTTKLVTSKYLQLYTLGTSLIEYIHLPIKKADHWILPIIRDNPANSVFEVLLSDDIIVGFRVLTQDEINNLLNK